MDTSGRIHEVLSEVHLRELEKKHGKLTPIPADQVAAVQAMSIGDRLKWLSKQAHNAPTIGLSEDEERAERNARKRQRRARRGK